VQRVQPVGDHVEVGLDRRDGVATDSPGPHTLNALARWRAEHGWRTAEHDRRWHNGYHTAAIENR
jgi:hypothetical protein